MGAAGRGQGRACPTHCPGPRPPCHPPRAATLPALGTPPVPRGHPGSVAPSTPHLAGLSPCSEAGGQGGAGDTGQRGWEAVLALLLWRAGAARPSPRSDHSLEERRLLLGGLWGQQLGFCLWRQVLQVVLAPDWSGQELPALWGTPCQRPGTTALGLPGPSLVDSPQCTGIGKGGIWMGVEMRLGQGRD